MRLFGKVDSAINRYDRATWLTGGLWGGFDLPLSAPVTIYGITADFDCTLAISAAFDATLPAVVSAFDATLPLTAATDSTV